MIASSLGLLKFRPCEINKISGRNVCLQPHDTVSGTFQNMDEITLRIRETKRHEVLLQELIISTGKARIDGQKCITKMRIQYIIH